MRSRMLLTGIMLGFGFILAGLQEPIRLQGCAPVPHPGQWVDIRDETALIVWDSSNKTEHFVRRALFETQADDFGFMVPTPTRPDLGEVDDRIFESAGMITAPRHVYVTEYRTQFGFGDLSGLKSGAMTTNSAAPNSMPTVEVLEQKKVAGFDATVLRADDTDALVSWLNDHGYESRPALKEWLKWYVDHQWVITAFKLSRDDQSQQNQMAGKGLRMSFQTDKPFYPYREPEDMRQPSGRGSRTLRVFLLADQKYGGTLGEETPWHAKVVWANSISGWVANLSRKLNLSDPQAVASLENAQYLTEFEDTAFPRPGTEEVYFQPASDQTSLERSPIVHKTNAIRYWPGPQGAMILLISLGVLVLGIGAWFVRRMLLRSATAESI